MKKIIIAFAILISTLVSYAQNTITKNVIVDAPGWKRVAKFSGSAGRGYNEITILTKGGTVAPTVSKISWFKGYSDYGGIHTETLSRVRYWSQARITFDGTNGFLEINFTKEIPSLTIHLNRAAWTGGTIFEGTLPNRGGDVVTGTITNFGRFNVASNKLFVNNGNGHVGIGTANPSALLEIKSGKDKNSELHLNTTTKDKVSVLRFQDEGKSSWGFLSNYPNEGKFNLYNYKNANKKYALTIDKESNVGIGITTPSAQLVVGSNFGASISGTTGGNAIFGSNIAVQQGGNNHDKIYTPYTHNNKYGYAGIRASWGKLLFYTNKENTVANQIVTPEPKMFINDTGDVAIGTSDTKGFKLGVNGKIAATEVKVATYSNWPDFVFKKEYKLPTLTEVENHIKEKGHLQNISSAKEVEKNGFFLGEMDAKLLQKIEELTLYTIQQEKELQSQKTQIRKQENEILELKKQNKEIEKLKVLVKQLIDSKK